MHGFTWQTGPWHGMCSEKVDWIVETDTTPWRLFVWFQGDMECAMKNNGNILFATDFSESARPVQRYAFDFAKRTGATLHIIHVVDEMRFTAVGLYGFGGFVSDGVEVAKEFARTDLAEVIRVAIANDVPTEPHLALGTPGSKICTMAEELGCSLIIVGTHGRSGFSKLFFGSTCEQVLRLSRVPVLTVRQHEDLKPDKVPVVPPKRILCPCDLTDLSRQALPLAASACKDFGASLILMHVVDTRVEYPMFAPTAAHPHVEELRRSAQKQMKSMAESLEDLSPDVAVITGVPHHEIIETARFGNIDLLVMATHGRSGLAHALLGSTTEKVVRSVPCPVLTMRPREKSSHAQWEKASREAATHTGA